MPELEYLASYKISQKLSCHASKPWSHARSMAKNIINSTPKGAQHVIKIIWHVYSLNGQYVTKIWLNI